MAMSPFAVSLLGMDTVERRRRAQQQERGAATPQEGVEVRSARASKKAASHYNSFQTICSPANDLPPCYAIASRHRPQVRRAVTEPLPGYSCTVDFEAKLLLQLESINPLHGVSPSDWREVYIVLRGTLLSLFRVKDGGPGKLLRSYTLQHAEVGLALDTQHTVLIPQTRLAHLLPSSARRRAWQKDPDMYRAAKQTILRLRAETDQFILADSSEDRVHDLIYALSAAIDISHGIDERSIPKQCTVPRRRRRRAPIPTGDLNDPALMAEQERILREMYPEFAERSLQSPPDPPDLVRMTTNVSVEPLPTPAHEEDELDLSVMREDFAAPGDAVPEQRSNATRPTMSRQTTSSSINSNFDSAMIYATCPSNFTDSGKWQPPHPRTAAQIQRYVRRCMPILSAHAVRASDVLISNGKRVKINWRMELLEDWELKPPSYRAHHSFSKEEGGLERSRSQSSASGSATQSNPQFASSLHGGMAAEDAIETLETGFGGLEIRKTETVMTESPTRDKFDHATVQQPQPQEQTERKVLEAGRQMDTPMHGVVFCF